MRALTFTLGVPKAFTRMQGTAWVQVTAGTSLATLHVVARSPVVTVVAFSRTVTLPIPPARLIGVQIVVHVPPFRGSQEQFNQPRADTWAVRVLLGNARFLLARA